MAAEVGSRRRAIEALLSASEPALVGRGSGGTGGGRTADLGGLRSSLRSSSSRSSNGSGPRPSPAKAPPCNEGRAREIADGILMMRRLLDETASASSSLATPKPRPLEVGGQGSPTSPRSLWREEKASPLPPARAFDKLPLASSLASCAEKTEGAESAGSSSQWREEKGAPLPPTRALAKALTASFSEESAGGGRPWREEKGAPLPPPPSKALGRPHPPTAPPERGESTGVPREIVPRDDGTAASSVTEIGPPPPSRGTSAAVSRASPPPPPPRKPKAASSADAAVPPPPPRQAASIEGKPTEGPGRSIARRASGGSGSAARRRSSGSDDPAREDPIPSSARARSAVRGRSASRGREGLRSSFQGREAPLAPADEASAGQGRSESRSRMFRAEYKEPELEAKPTGGRSASRIRIGRALSRGRSESRNRGQALASRCRSASRGRAREEGATKDVKARASSAIRGDRSCAKSSAGSGSNKASKEEPMVHAPSSSSSHKKEGPRDAKTGGTSSNDGEDKCHKQQHKWNKYGRCVKHPSIIVAKKKPFGKGWTTVSKDGCQLCLDAESKAGGKKHGPSGGASKNDYGTKYGKSSAKKGMIDIKTATKHEPRSGGNGNNGGEHPADKSHAPTAAPNENNCGKSLVSKMRYTTPWGKSGRYSGETRDGVPHGRGRMRFDDGEQYSGEWTNGYSEQFLENEGRMKRGFSKAKCPWREQRGSATSHNEEEGRHEKGREEPAPTQSQQQPQQQQPPPGQQVYYYPAYQPVYYQPVMYPQQGYGNY